MFTDIQGYTAMMQKDEGEAIATRNRHREVFKSVTEKYNGNILQYYGDGTLSIFSTALEAVQCGTELQLIFREKPSIPVRIGIDLGEITYDKEDIIGEGVNAASRIESLGQPGCVLISDKINDELTHQRSIRTELIDKYNFESNTGPREVFAVVHPGLVIPDRAQVRSLKALKFIGLAGLSITLAFLIYLAVANFSELFSQTELDKSVAVLPFTNMSDDPFQEYISDGITEEIINHLAEINDLTVISKTSIMNYKNSEKSIKKIGEELGVSNILEGSVRKQGNQIRVSAKLINAKTDNYLWTKTYDGQLSEIFSLQIDLALDIVSTLKATSTELELDQREPTQNFSAYDSYLKGIHQFETYSVEGYNEAIKLFNETIEADPNFDAAYGRLALSYIYLASWAGDMPSEEARQKAVPIVDKALELNENSYLAHNAMALIYFWFDWNFQEAEKSFKRGMEVSSGGANIIFYQQFLINMGRFKEAMDLGEKALETDPLHYGIYLETGLSHFFLKQYDQAEETLKEGIRLNPAILDLYNKLGKVYLNTGKYNEAIVELEKGLSLTNTRPPSMLAYLAIARSRNGQPEFVLSLLKELKERKSDGEKGIALFLAHLYSALEDDEMTLNWLEIAHKEHEVDLIWLNVEPQFDNIRNEPRFQAIIKAMGFPE